MYSLICFFLNVPATTVFSTYCHIFPYPTRFRSSMATDREIRCPSAGRYGSASREVGMSACNSRADRRQTHAFTLPDHLAPKVWPPRDRGLDRQSTRLNSSH